MGGKDLSNKQFEKLAEKIRKIWAQKRQFEEKDLNKTEWAWYYDSKKNRDEIAAHIKEKYNVERPTPSEARPTFNRHVRTPADYAGTSVRDRLPHLPASVQSEAVQMQIREAKARQAQEQQEKRKKAEENARQRHKNNRIQATPKVNPQPGRIVPADNWTDEDYRRMRERPPPRTTTTTTTTTTTRPTAEPKPTPRPRSPSPPAPSPPRSPTPQILRQARPSSPEHLRRHRPTDQSTPFPRPAVVNLQPRPPPPPPQPQPFHVAVPEIPPPPAQNPPPPPQPQPQAAPPAGRGRGRGRGRGLPAVRPGGEQQPRNGQYQRIELEPLFEPWQGPGPSHRGEIPMNQRLYPGGPNREGPTLPLLARKVDRVTRQAGHQARPMDLHTQITVQDPSRGVVDPTHPRLTVWQGERGGVYIWDRVTDRKARLPWLHLWQGRSKAQWRTPEYLRYTPMIPRHEVGGVAHRPLAYMQE